jgi:dsRNA-specific ribonuclease
VTHQSVVLGKGGGKSKKAAESEAALDALAKMRGARKVI